MGLRRRTCSCNGICCLDDSAGRCIATAFVIVSMFSAFDWAELRLEALFFMIACPS